MSFARRVLVGALIIEILGFLREIFFAIGIEHYLQSVLTGTDPTLVVATIVFAAALLLLGPIWRGNRWATLASAPLMLLLLVAVVPAAAPVFGTPNAGNFAVWLTLTVIVVAAAVGFAFSIGATLESFGRKAPTTAVVGSHFSPAVLVLAAVIGSVGGMALLGAVVAASPSEAEGAIDGRPDNFATVVLHDLRFEPADLQLEAGVTTAVFVVNEDSFDHSFDVDELDIHVHVAAGQTRVVMVTPPSVGALRLYCSIPGHAAAGMVGQLVSH